MAADLESVVKSCLHCACSGTGNIVSRSLGHALHAAQPSERLHFDVCCVMPSEKYDILIPKDDLKKSDVTDIYQRN